MLLDWLWLLMILASITYNFLFGQAENVLTACMQGCEEAIAITLKLGAGYLLFCGLMEIVQALKVPEKIEKGLRPFLRLVMPHVQKQETKTAICLNLSANLLGIGNAATPMGIEAMRLMDEENSPLIRHSMMMFLVINATSLQLLPTTILTLRIQAGSSQPSAILLPTILCTAVSTAVGIWLALLCRKGYKNER